MGNVGIIYSKGRFRLAGMVGTSNLFTRILNVKITYFCTKLSNSALYRAEGFACISYSPIMVNITGTSISKVQRSSVLIRNKFQHITGYFSKYKCRPALSRHMLIVIIDCSNRKEVCQDKFLVVYYI